MTDELLGNHGRPFMESMPYRAYELLQDVEYRDDFDKYWNKVMDRLLDNDRKVNNGRITSSDNVGSMHIGINVTTSSAS